MKPDGYLPFCAQVFGIRNRTEDKEQETIEMDKGITEFKTLFRPPGDLPDQRRTDGCHMGQEFFRPKVMVQVGEISFP